MSKPSDELLKFMQTYKVAKEEVWEVHGSTWVVKHKALERVAIEQNIVWQRPAVITCDPAQKFMVVMVEGKLGERVEWSFGEAAPYNNKNGYPAAMAEKRAKDRVILKLLNAHCALYSEAEADEFAAGGDDAPRTTLPKKDAKGIYVKLQAEIDACQTRDQLKDWMKGNAERIKTMPEDWQDILRLRCEEMLLDLRNKEAA